MTTVGELVDQCSALLHSYTGTREAVTYLTSAIDASATELPVAHADKIIQGLIEVGDELMEVDAVGDGSATLMPFGRGAAGSTATTHATDTKVLVDPDVPRVKVFQAIQRVVRDITPELFSVTTATFTSSPVQTTYEIPADAHTILKVQYEVIGPTQEWPTVNHWSLDHNADTATGKALVVTSCIQAGRTVQVVYTKLLTTPATMDVDLEGSGIPASMHGVLLYGAASELALALESSRLNTRAVEAKALSGYVAAGDATKFSQQLFARYDLARREERARLLSTHPPVKHYSARL